MPRAVHVKVLPRNEQVGATRLLKTGRSKCDRIDAKITRKHGHYLACVAEAVQVRSHARGVALGQRILKFGSGAARLSRLLGPREAVGPPALRPFLSRARCTVKKTNYNPYSLAFFLDSLFETRDEPHSPGEPEK